MTINIRDHIMAQCAQMCTHFKMLITFVFMQYVEIKLRKYDLHYHSNS